MKINSVKFKDKASFDKNKTKANVIAVHEPFGLMQRVRICPKTKS